MTYDRYLSFTQKETIFKFLKKNLLEINFFSWGNFVWSKNEARSYLLLRKKRNRLLHRNMKPYTWKALCALFRARFLSLSGPNIVSGNPNLIEIRTVNRLGGVSMNMRRNLERTCYTEMRDLFKGVSNVRRLLMWLQITISTISIRANENLSLLTKNPNNKLFNINNNIFLFTNIRCFLKNNLLFIL